MTTKPQAKPLTPHIPLIYLLFFLYLEPLSALAGAYYAYLYPSLYLHLLHFPALPPPPPFPLPPTTHITLTQLSNLYLLFAIQEFFTLRATRPTSTNPSLRPWKTFLACLLVADVGHLWSVRGFAAEGVYWRVGEWNGMAWGGVGVVYVGAVLRVAFLLGVGMGAKGKGIEKEG